MQEEKRTITIKKVRVCNRGREEGGGIEKMERTEQSESIRSRSAGFP